MRRNIGMLAQTRGTRGIFAGGYNNVSVAVLNSIGFIQVETQGDSTNFGNLSINRGWSAGLSSSTRTVFGGANVGPSTWAGTNTIDFITVATTGNATNFGNLPDLKWSMGSCSSETRGIFVGGSKGDANLFSAFDQITIASTGNTTNFGTLFITRRNLGSVNSPTRGVFAGGEGPINSSTRISNIEFITIASAGNGTSFGNLTNGARAGQGSVCSQTRGVFLGGNNTASADTSAIEFITIASGGDSTNFGNLSLTINQCGSASSKVRGVIAGGIRGTATRNNMEFINIATTGNGTNFGNLYSAVQGVAGASNNHGGI